MRCAFVIALGEDIEMCEPESDTSDGVSPTESGMDTSERAGEVNGCSILILTWAVVIVGGRFESAGGRAGGRANERE